MTVELMEVNSFNIYHNLIMLLFLLKSFIILPQTKKEKNLAIIKKNFKTLNFVKDTRK